MWLSGRAFLAVPPGNSTVTAASPAWTASHGRCISVLLSRNVRFGRLISAGNLRVAGNRRSYAAWPGAGKGQTQSLLILEAMNMASPGHLALMSMLIGRNLKWDANKERILGDVAASKLPGRYYGQPWQLA